MAAKPHPISSLPDFHIVNRVQIHRIAGDYVLAGANLLLGVFNLLPVPSLDGGRALFLLVSWGADPGTADQLCRCFSVF